MLTNGSTVRTLAVALLTLSALSGCTGLQTNSAIDRLKPAAAAHARSLTGDDMAEARKTGLALIAELGAYADWGL